MRTTTSGVQRGAPSIGPSLLPACRILGALLSMGIACSSPDETGSGTTTSSAATTSSTTTFDDSCPVEMPTSSTACAEGLECGYGSESCCGETFPSWICTCSFEGWGCHYTDACLYPQCGGGGGSGGHGGAGGSGGTGGSGG